MASIEFDVQTIHNTMDLIDEHREDISENEYIKICNMLKSFYKKTSGDKLKSVVSSYINHRIMSLRFQKNILLQSDEFIRMPFINNKIRNRAICNIVEQYNLSEERVCVHTMIRVKYIQRKRVFNKDNPIKLNIHIRKCLGEIPIRSTDCHPENNYINGCKQYIFSNGISKKEYDLSIKVAQKEVHAENQKNFIEKEFHWINEEVNSINDLKDFLDSE